MREITGTVRPAPVDNMRALAGALGIFCAGLMAALFLTLPALALSPLDRAALPLHMLALLLLGTGAARLRNLERPDPDAFAYANLLFVAVLLECYGLPFLLWWQKFPGVAWFRGNVVLLSSITCWLLMMLCGLAARVGLLVGNLALARLARFASWAMLAFLLLPALLLTRNGPEGLVGSAGRPALVQSALSIPLLLTLILLWEGREACLRQARIPRP